MKTVLFLNCSAHTESEEVFWLAVAERLKRQRLNLVMHHMDAVKTSLNGLPPGLISGPFSSSQEQAALYRTRASEWGHYVAESSLAKNALTAHALISLIRPDFVLFWSGEHVLQVLVKDVLRKCGCAFASAERTPWPGMISLDQAGNLANSSFLAEDIHWEDEPTRDKWKRVFGEYEQQVRDIGTTWWEQPLAKRDWKPAPPGFKTVLFAGQIDADAQNFLFSPHFQNNLDAFSWFAGRAQKYPLYLLGKHHPRSRDAPELYAQAISEGRGIWTSDVPLNAALERSDGVVAVNSSILCEAMIHRKPAFALGRTMVESSGVLPTINSKEDTNAIDSWLEKLSRGDAGVSSESVAKWKEFSAWHFARNLFSMAAPPARGGLNGATSFAEKLIALVQASDKPCWENDYMAEARLKVYEAIFLIHHDNATLKSSPLLKFSTLVRRLASKLKGLGNKQRSSRLRP